MEELVFVVAKYQEDFISRFPLCSSILRGHATIVLQEFFPADAVSLKKLLKMIGEDYAHQDELRETIVTHCRRRIEALLSGQQGLANRAADCYNRAADLERD